MSKGRQACAVLNSGSRRVSLPSAHDIRSIKARCVGWMGHDSGDDRFDVRCRQTSSVGADRNPRSYSGDDRELVVGSTGADALRTHRQGAVTIVMDVIEADVEKRWAAWKFERTRLDAIRASRTRKLFTTLAVASVLWLLSRA
jgi:prophage tail gpP-like protein